MSRVPSDKEIQRVIGRIEKDYGRVESDVLVNLAKDPNHPAHEWFDWDRNKAAEAHWRSVALGYIRRYTVVVETVAGGTKRIHALVKTKHSGKRVFSKVKTRDKPDVFSTPAKSMVTQLKRMRDEAEQLGMVDDQKQLLAEAQQALEEFICRLLSSPTAQFVEVERKTNRRRSSDNRPSA